jgi:UDP-GlcNAc3NAcA epimerase
MKIVTVVGARPQFVKAAVLSRLCARIGDLEEIIIHTGQHYDRSLSAVFFEDMSIPEPHYQLSIGSGPHGAMTGRMLEAIEAVLLKEMPNAVLVYGDTNSTLAGALAAAKLCIPVLHVEAGMRCFVASQVEEINRVLCDHCSALCLTTSSVPSANLLHEGIPQGRIRQVGDVMYDALLYYLKEARNAPLPIEVPSDYALVTVHRAENTDDPTQLSAIVEGLIAVADKRPLVLPLHPRTRARLQDYGLLKKVESSLIVLEPVSYFAMLRLAEQASIILTDSGGVQREAYWLQRPCIVLRDRTEWTELVSEAGHQLTTDFTRLPQMVEAAMGQKHRAKADLFGRGDAGEKILESIRECLGKGAPSGSV